MDVQRWTERKSRLAVLDGFEFFTLCRRVDVPAGEAVDFDYISFTVWENKKSFNAWRTGEAFKEAHGGGSLWGFVSMIVTSLSILKGPPKPAFYEGLRAERVAAQEQPEVVEGWRSIESDGVKPLPAECYVEGHKYVVLPGQAAAFEAAYAAQERELSALPGFRFQSLLRRDAGKGEKKGHGDDPGMDADGVNYMAVSIWQDKAAFEQAKEQMEGLKIKSAELVKYQPQPIYYEGMLVLEN